MKSKRSLFNFHIALNNLKRFWPIWAGYLFVILLMLPAVLKFNYSPYSTHETIRDNIMRDIVGGCVYAALVLSMVAGIIIALAMFSYLQKERSCSFYHSLPVTRNSLFTTNFITGYAMMFIPNLIAVIFAGLVCSEYSFLPFGRLMYWLLIVSLSDLFFLALAVLCMMFTGQLWSGPVLYMIALGYVPVMIFMINMISDNLFYGVTGDVLDFPEGIFGIINPCYYFLKQDFDDIFPMLSTNHDIRLNFIAFIATVIVATALLILADVVTYRKRRSESANDLIAISIARPIFRVGFGLSFGILISFILYINFFTTAVNNDKLVLTIIVPVISAIGYFLAEMMMSKTFRVFKYLWKKNLIFIVVIGLLAFTYFYDVLGFTQIMPDKASVISASLGPDYYYNSLPSFEGREEIDFIYQLNKHFIDNRKHFEEERRIAANTDYNDNNYYSGKTITFSLKLKNGKEFKRNYYFYNDPEIENMIDEFKQDHALEYVFGKANENSVEDIELYLNKEWFEYITGIKVNDRTQPFADVYSNVSEDEEAIDLFRLNISKKYYEQVFSGILKDVEAHNISVDYLRNGTVADLELLDMYGKPAAVSESLYNYKYEDSTYLCQIYSLNWEALKLSGIKSLDLDSFETGIYGDDSYHYKSYESDPYRINLRYRSYYDDATRSFLSGRSYYTNQVTVYYKTECTGILNALKLQ